MCLAADYYEWNCGSQRRQQYKNLNIWRKYTFAARSQQIEAICSTFPRSVAIHRRVFFDLYSFRLHPIQSNPIQSTSFVARPGPLYFSERISQEMIPINAIAWQSHILSFAIFHHENHETFYTIVSGGPQLATIVCHRWYLPTGCK